VEPVDAPCLPPKEITVEVPAKETWWQIEMDKGDYQYFKTLKEVRTLLLQGRITRNHYCRELTPRPVPGPSADASQRAIARWETNTAWERIGDGLAKKHHSIELIYDPVGAHMRTVETTFTVIVSFAALIALITADAYAGWPIGKTFLGVGGSLVDDSSAALSSGQRIVAMTLAAVMSGVYALVAGIVAALSAMTLSPIGAGLGNLIGRNREKDIPLAPADGWSGRTYRTDYSLRPAIMTTVMLAVVLLLGWRFIPRLRAPSADGAAVRVESEPSPPTMVWVSADAFGSSFRQGAETSRPEARATRNPQSTRWSWHVSPFFECASHLSAPTGAAGSVKRKWAPLSTSASTEISPPWRWMMRWTMERPTPVPSNWSAECRRWKTPKRRLA
jgi:hypothetical protein